MMRKRNLPVSAPKVGRTEIAEFFGLTETDVVPQPQPETFSVLLRDNDYAINQYKTINKYGNTGAPGQYNFERELLVRWTGVKVQPC
jgi:hypothetical protein